MSSKLANGLLVVTGAVIILAYLGSQADQQRSNVADGTRGAANLVSYDRVRDLMPDTERALIAAVERGRAAYISGSNDMAKGASRPSRARDLCTISGLQTATRWVGRISELSSNSEGRGVLAVEIAKDISLKTWNNSISDAGDRTLIEPDSLLYGKAVALSKGQYVAFSGTFLRSATDCIKESSLTISGSMTDPEFVFRFTDIGPITF
ncbi:hypothetical protein [Enterovirga aerilata]|uniref:Uncharacterized protein n=1 Tax=Enterovirga aerilata TaxID=2730920 RepID=A0A849I6F4_9HYPH|nr:hypothetical protein [Enterovirga sp. DB1703]NNM71905.1 hypothetical protein [Enterovirga sp. DB1703]